MSLIKTYLEYMGKPKSEICELLSIKFDRCYDENTLNKWIRGDQKNVPKRVAAYMFETCIRYALKLEGVDVHTLKVKSLCKRLSN